MRIVLLGAPGSGKGTQGDLIRDAYGFPKISTGDLLRQAVQFGTPLGLKAQGEMSRGGLVSDDLVVELVRERIGRPDCRGGYILDGFPRNLFQAKRLDELDGERPEIVLEIELPVEKLVKRLASRLVCADPACGTTYNLQARRPAREGVCDACRGELVSRPDDRPEVIRERLRVYKEQTEPLLEYYERKGHLHRLDGSGGVEEVFARIRRVLDQALMPSGETARRT